MRRKKESYIHIAEAIAVTPIPTSDEAIAIAARFALFVTFSGIDSDIRASFHILF
jgi:hypothetical protein